MTGCTLDRLQSMQKARHRHARTAWLLVCLCLATLAGPAAPAFAAGAKQPVTVATSARLGGDNARTRFVAEVNRAIGYNVYVIPDPFRIILDLPEVEFRMPDANSRGRGLVSGYRFGRIDDKRSRIVLDATGPVLIDRSFVLRARNGKPARIVVDIVRTDRETFDELHRQEQPQPPPAPVSAMAALDQKGEPDSAQQPAEAQPEPEPSTDQVAATDVDTSPEPDEPAAPEAPAAPEPQDRSSKAPGSDAVPVPRPRPGKMLASKSPPADPVAKPRNRQRIIVLDPGHGGIDPGALSRGNKTKEKEIVLSFSLSLKKLLEKSGRYKVVLTREDDRFLPLRERVEIARNAEADLFLSIHADSIRRRSVRGATVYTVSDEASDEEAAELAQKENRADIIAGVDLATESEEIAGILIDLAQRETKNYSVSIAKKLVRHMTPLTRMNGRPLRSAGFRVLKAPDIPSVLLELGYLSSRADEKLLVSKRWRDKVAKGVSAAIDGYFATRLASGN